jgi:hypothetical protein
MAIYAYCRDCSAGVRAEVRRSTGPRTAAGKVRSADNGRSRQKGEKSIRQLRGDVADVCLLMDQMPSVAIVAIMTKHTASTTIVLPRRRRRQRGNGIDTFGWLA